MTMQRLRAAALRRSAVVVLIALVAPAGSPAPCAARQQGSAPAAAIAAQEGIVSTRHSIVLNGRPLAYTAHAGLLPIRVNDTGAVHAHMFFVAYTVETGSNAARRPLTFLWNGGPGSNATLVHVDGFGPKRLDPRPPPGAHRIALLDNATTWLDETDLVFVDPVGTGYSRAADTTYHAEFFNTLGDIASVAEFVRVWLTRFDAWDAPLFLAGESYGTWRAAGIAESFARRGIDVAGVILISGGIPVGDVVSDAMRAALFIPARSAAAFHHGKLTADPGGDLASTLRTVEQWARTVYAPALERRDSLSPAERRELASALARYTGLDPSDIDSDTLVVRRQWFAERLLGGDSVLGRFDTRRATAGGASGTRAGARTRTIIDYFRNQLGFRTDLAYQGLETGFTPPIGRRVTASVGARWNYNQNPPASEAEAAARRSGLRPLVWEGPPNGSEPWLLRAMTIDSGLRAFVVTGMYDSLNSCAFNAHLASALERSIAARVTTACHVGGHMMYEDEETRVRLKDDIVAFIRTARR